MKKILIVEDDKAIAALEADYLEISGFASDTAYDGESGLHMALADEYDLILLDVMLPGIDGFTVCSKIRAKKEIPILLVTAREESTDKIQGLGLGADDYITKPFEPAELVARVRAHLARYERLTAVAQPDAADGEQPLDFGRLVIHPQSHRVFVDGAELRFTNREYELLLFLATNPNVVFSKETLFERIWGLDAIGDTATVTVHINRIRDKVEKDPQQPQYIQTIWGVGYRYNLQK